jgi:hypothetical protein
VHVENLLVEQIVYSAEDTSATADATLYEFGERRWVSPRRGVEGDSLGPITVLDTDAKSFELPTAKVHAFPPYPLHVDPRKRSAISHVALWTVESETVYAVVLPSGFVAEELSILANDEAVDPDIGGSDDERLFYWSLFMGRRYELRVSGLLVQDEQRATRELESVGVVRGRSRFERLSDSVPRPEVDSSYWWKFLEYGQGWFS